MANKLTLNDLQQAVKGMAAAFRCRIALQPAGGRGTKVFPPTYSGAVYATEKRRVRDRDEPVECVVLDSVQSQANRMEEALQLAVDTGRINLPVIEVDFEPYFPGDDQPADMRLLDPVGKVSSLQAPHRIADAILRDSLLHGTPFRRSEIGRAVDRVSLQNATPLFELCPTALLLGMWDSTGPKGGLGAKFERAMVSEIVGINAVYGVKTSSRIDPLGIARNAGPLYRTPNGGWTLDPGEALDELQKGKPTGKKLLYKQNSKGQDVAHNPGDEKFADQGRPSEANHGNVTPDIDRYKENKELRDPLSAPDVDAAWSLRLDDAEILNRQKMRVSNQLVRSGQAAVGGVTIDHADQTIVISLPALRRLRFPVKGEHSRERDIAAQTVLTALGLTAAALADEAGQDLRSRCLLYCEDDLTWELLARKQGGQFTLSADEAVELFRAAVESAKRAGLPWRDNPLVLQPSDQLVKLVVKSQSLAAQQGGDAEGGE